MKGGSMPRGGDHDIYIIEDGADIRVRPAVTFVKGGPGSHVKVRNLTPYEAWIWLPSQILDPAEPRSKSLDPSGSRNQATSKKTDRLDFKLSGANPDTYEGCYDYQVIVITGQGVVVAKGESGPKMIIDP